MRCAEGLAVFLAALPRLAAQLLARGKPHEVSHGRLLTTAHIGKLYPGSVPLIFARPCWYSSNNLNTVRDGGQRGSDTPDYVLTADLST